MLQVVVPVDSTTIFHAIQNFFPGMEVGFVALLAGFGASRALWLMKALAGLLPIVADIPQVHAMEDVVKAVWSKFAWIINPALMILAGWVTTHQLDKATVIAFAGIGIREWLIKSPIPTSKDQLMKLKGALVLLLFLCPISAHAAGVTKAFIPTDPNANGLSLAKEFGAQYYKTTPENISVSVVKKDKYSLIDHVKLSINGGYGFESGNESYPWAAVSPVYIINGRFSLRYDVYDNFKEKSWNHRVGLNYVLF